MKNYNGTNFLNTLVSISPHNDEASSKQSNNGYSKEFQSLLDSLEEEDCAEESTALINGKKKRLNLEKVKALEKYFELDNKLDPNRKAKIAEELGLQPRQIAIWFQNRRARLKSKHMEKKYGILKSEYDVLKVNFDVLEREKVALNAEVRDLKLKLQRKTETITTHSVSENNFLEKNCVFPNGFCNVWESNKLTHDLFNNIELERFVDFKDGPSDSDSSEIMLNFASTVNGYQLSNAEYQNQFRKVEDQSFYGATQESCTFSVDEGHIMQWYNLD